MERPVVAKCDSLDGVRDGVVADQADCHFDPRTQIGRSTPCGLITSTDAKVIAQIWQGPRTGTGRFRWYGPEPDSETSHLADSPWCIATAWFQYWVTQNPDFDWTTMTTEDFVRLFEQGVDEFGLLSSDSADLTRFRDAGGKLVLWAGQSDPIIPPQGTIHYYDRVVSRMGGPDATGSFARLFLAPGVGHCLTKLGTVGPEPTTPLNAVTKWVENGAPPASIGASKVVGGKVVESRPLCPYPLVARYAGRGSTGDAANFFCARHFAHQPR